MLIDGVSVCYAVSYVPSLFPLLSWRIIECSGPQSQLSACWHSTQGQILKPYVWSRGSFLELSLLTPASYGDKKNIRARDTGCFLYVCRLFNSVLLVLQQFVGAFEYSVSYHCGVLLPGKGGYACIPASQMCNVCMRTPWKDSGKPSSICI